MTRKTVFWLVLILLSLLACEGIARWAFDGPTFEKAVAGDYSDNWRRRWVSSHKKKAKTQLDGNDRFDPTQGWLPKPNLKAGRLTTNSEGLRSLREHSHSERIKPDRILILGDSFTFGEEVGDKETFPYFLQQMLPENEVINMGVHGYGQDQILLLLENLGVKYKPEVVILGYMPLDNRRNLLNFRDFAKPRFVPAGAGLRLEGVPLPSPAEVLDSDWRHSRLLELTRLVAARRDERSGNRKSREDQVTRRILQRIAEVSKQHGAKVIFAYLPRGQEIRTPKPPVVANEEKFFGMCQAAGAACLSVRPRMVAKRKFVSMRPKGHWGPCGHYVAATTLKDYLIENGYFESEAAADVTDTTCDISLKMGPFTVHPLRQGWGNLKINKSAASRPLSIGRRRYKGGIGTHAPSTIELDLPASSGTLTGYCGVDDFSGRKGEIVCKILARGKVLFASKPIQGGQPAVPFSVQTHQTDTVQLIMDPSGSMNHDHANWVALEFTAASQKQP